MDSLAEILDCKPRPLNYIYSDPRLAHALIFGPNVSYVYRLRGTNVWNGARDAIVGIKKRTEMCLTERNIEEDDKMWDNFVWYRMLPGLIALLVIVLAKQICFI